MTLATLARSGVGRSPVDDRNHRRRRGLAGATPGAIEVSRAAAQEEADEAERQGRARGIDVSCVVRNNCSPTSIGGNPGPVECRYWAECSVNGSTGHDAGLLTNPGGWDIARAEIATARGRPITREELLTTPWTPDDPLAGSDEDDSGSDDRAAANPDVVLDLIPPDLLSKPKAWLQAAQAWTGLPAWAVLSGAGLGLYLLLFRRNR